MLLSSNEIEINQQIKNQISLILSQSSRETKIEIDQEIKDLLLLRTTMTLHRSHQQRQWCQHVKQTSKYAYLSQLTRSQNQNRIRLVRMILTSRLISRHLWDLILVEVIDCEIGKIEHSNSYCCDIFYLFKSTTSTFYTCINITTHDQTRPFYQRTRTTLHIFYRSMNLKRNKRQ